MSLFLCDLAAIYVIIDARQEFCKFMIAEQSLLCAVSAGVDLFFEPADLPADGATDGRFPAG